MIADGAALQIWFAYFVTGPYPSRAPHLGTEARGSAAAHARVRTRERGLGDWRSQRCGKLIEELVGEGKDWHGLRGFRWRGLRRVRQETYLIGRVLNLKPWPSPTTQPR